MSCSFDVIVIGGGIVGLSAAIAMQQRNFSVAILDAGSLVDDGSVPNARVYALNHASQSLFQTLGVWSALDKTRISPYRQMHVWDATNGAHIDFDSRMIGADQLGVIVDESVIKQALLQQAVECNITLFPHCAVDDVQSTGDGMLVRHKENAWHAKLLIVADGTVSETRQRLGVAVTSWPYHQQAIVTTVQTEKPHRHTAHQVFNPDGPLAFLPLADPFQCSIVWSTSPARAQRLMDLSDDEFSQQLMIAFVEKLGKTAVIGQRHQFPLFMRHANCYSGSDWLLMGDAAHTIHPLAGLGLNVGLADVTAWLAIIDADKHPIWSNKALRAYQRQRKHDVWQIIAIMEGLKALFANPLPPIAMLRGIGLSGCNHLPFLKRLFIEHAAG